MPVRFSDAVPRAAVLLPDGSQAALFRLDDGSLHAIGNIDPFSGAAVLSRGIVGDRGGRAVVQSPIKKQAFALDDGSCLDDPRCRYPSTGPGSRLTVSFRSPASTRQCNERYVRESIGRAGSDGRNVASSLVVIGDTII